MPRRAPGYSEIDERLHAAWEAIKARGIDPHEQARKANRVDRLRRAQQGKLRLEKVVKP